MPERSQCDTLHFNIYLKNIITIYGLNFFLLWIKKIDILYLRLFFTLSTIYYKILIKK